MAPKVTSSRTRGSRTASRRPTSSATRPQRSRASTAQTTQGRGGSAAKPTNRVTNASRRPTGGSGRGSQRVTGGTQPSRPQLPAGRSGGAMAVRPTGTRAVLNGKPVVWTGSGWKPSGGGSPLATRGNSSPSSPRPARPTVQPVNVRDLGSPQTPKVSGGSRPAISPGRNGGSSAARPQLPPGRPGGVLTQVGRAGLGAVLGAAGQAALVGAQALSVIDRLNPNSDYNKQRNAEIGNQTARNTEQRTTDRLRRERSQGPVRPERLRQQPAPTARPSSSSRSQAPISTTRPASQPASRPSSSQASSSRPSQPAANQDNFPQPPAPPKVDPQSTQAKEPKGDQQAGTGDFYGPPTSLRLNRANKPKEESKSTSAARPRSNGPIAGRDQLLQYNLDRVKRKKQGN